MSSADGRLRQTQVLIGRAVVAMLVVGVWGSAVRAQAPTPRVVALTGRPVPGVASSAYTVLHRPAVGAGGRIFFGGEYNAPGGFKRVLMSAAAGGGEALIYRREGDAVVEFGGLPSQWTGGFTMYAAADTTVAFVGTNSSGGPGPGTGVWLGGVQMATTAVGTVAPGTADRFVQFDSVALAGRTTIDPGLIFGPTAAVRASTSGASTANTGLWMADQSLVLVAIEGGTSPDLPAGVVFDDFGNVAFDPATTPTLAVFLAPLRGAGVTSGNNRGIFAGIGPIQKMLARTGSAATGMPAGAVFATLDRPWIAGNQIVFTGRVTGGGVTGNDDEALWVASWPLGDVSLVIREGVAAPGIGGGVLLKERTAATASFRQTVIDATGRIGFVSGLLGTGITNDNDSVVYLASRDPGGVWQFTLLAREGQDAPGLTAGVDRYGVFGQVWLNGRGEVAFTNQIGNQTWGLFAGRAGAIGLVAAANRTIDVGATGAPDVRTVKFFYNQFGPAISSGGGGGGGSGDGLATCLSDNGGVVYRAEFTDNSVGVFEYRLRPAQTADYNQDGQISVQDIFDYLAGWFAMNPNADFNGDGMTTVQDIFDFLAAWFGQQ